MPLLRWISPQELTGVLPESISGYVNLQQLNLHFNALSGPVPLGLGCLTNLLELYVMPSEQGRFISIYYKTTEICTTISWAEVFLKVFLVWSTFSACEWTFLSSPSWSREWQWFPDTAEHSTIINWVEVFRKASPVWSISRNCEWHSVTMRRIRRLLTPWKRYLQDNQLSGPIPEGIGELSQLHRL